MKYASVALLMLIAGIFTVNPTSADWADKDQYAIDKSTNTCLSKATSTGGESACWEEAYKKWDQDLNKEYKNLMSKLSPAQRKHLQASEVQWLKFRDAELNLIDDVYTHCSGSMFAPAQAASRVRIVRDRVILLKHYSKLIEGL